jgi:hypothetical protein
MTTDLFTLNGLPAVAPPSFNAVFIKASMAGDAQADEVALAYNIIPKKSHGGFIAGLRRKGLIELVDYSLTVTPQSHRRLTRRWRWKGGDRSDC